MAIQYSGQVGLEHLECSTWRLKREAEGREHAWCMEGNVNVEGAQPVVDSLTEISKTYGIKLRVEKFDW